MASLVFLCVLVLGVLIVLSHGAGVQLGSVNFNASHDFNSFSTDELISKTGTSQRTRICQCGRKSENRIIGGEPAKPGWCWQVMLLIVKRGLLYQCGGTIINDRYILTAAHCVHGAPAKNVTVLAGKYNFTFGSESLTMQGIKIIVHKNYNARAIMNDIALVKVKKIKHSSTVCSACLPMRTNITEGDEATITGWGNTSPKGKVLPTTLMKATVFIVSHEYCKAAYGDHFRRTQICASAPGRDSCQGDSGGPMVIERKGIWHIIGVTSYGAGCANPKYPGVYSNVRDYMRWIREHTRDGEYCAV